MSEIRVVSCVWMRIRRVLLGDLVEEAVYYYFSFFFCILFAMLNGQAVAMTTPEHTALLQSFCTGQACPYYGHAHTCGITLECEVI